VIQLPDGLRLWWSQTLPTLAGWLFGLGILAFWFWPLGVIVYKAITPATPPEPIPDSVRIADSLWSDSASRADSAFNDSVERGLIRIIDTCIGEPDPDDDEHWSPSDRY
jgi:hypothetical protein